MRSARAAVTIVAVSLGCARAVAAEAPVPAASSPAISSPVASEPTALDRPATSRELVVRAEAGAGVPAPYIAMRDLQRLQDRIAGGDTLAAAAHAKAITRTAAAFVAAKPATWNDPRNARALVLYLFSGGNAGAIASSIPRAALPKGLQDLYEGAVAYGLGMDNRARDKLLAIDARSLPSGLGGHLALVQATLLGERDPAKAIEQLDLARLLEPGTLVEEAALRKEMLLIDPKTGDLAKFALLARRYTGSFSRSVYVPNFRQVVNQAALAIGGGNGPGADGRLSQIADTLEGADRRRLLLTVAREALLAGRMDMAAFAAEQAGRLSRKGEVEQARALVYFGASTVAGPRREAGREALSAAAGAGLDPGDEALRLAALVVSDTIRDPAFAWQPARGAGDAGVIGDGERALAEADGAIKAVDR